MNAEQKQRAQEAKQYWRASFDKDDVHNAGQKMAALLQELVDAPEPEPFGYFKPEPFGWTDCAETDDGAIALYELPAAPGAPDEELQAAFDRGLKAGNEQKEAQQVEIHRLHDLLAATPTQPEPPAELPTWENGDDPLVSGGLIHRGVVDLAMNQLLESLK